MEGSFRTGAVRKFSGHSRSRLARVMGLEIYASYVRIEVRWYRVKTPFRMKGRLFFAMAMSRAQEDMREQASCLHVRLFSHIFLHRAKPAT